MIYKSDADKPHTVYEFYAADGSCLYVGCSTQPKSRIASHKYKPWWPEVVRTVTTLYPTQAEGLAAEAARIRELDPPNNIEHTPRWAIRHAAYLERRKLETEEQMRRLLEQFGGA